MQAKTPKTVPVVQPVTESIVTVSVRAAEELKTALAAAQSEGTFEGVRLGLQQGGCCGPGYMLALAEHGQADDVVVEQNGIKVFLAKSDLESLRGTKLDYVETAMGAGFHVDNPNKVEKAEGDSCGSGGCGSGAGGCGCGSGGGHGHGGHGHGGSGGCGC